MIRRLARENPLWSVPHIRSELKLLGYCVAEATITKYLPKKPPGPRSPSWRTFWRNHATDAGAIGFFVVPTAAFRLLYVFLSLSPDRRRVVHFNVTPNHSAEWTAQQLIEAFPFDSAPRYLVRDNDRIYGGEFSRRLIGMGMRETALSFLNRTGSRRYVSISFRVTLGSAFRRRLSRWGGRPAASTDGRRRCRVYGRSSRQNRTAYSEHRRHRRLRDRCDR